MFINRGLRLERNNLHSIIYQSAYKGGWQKYAVLLILSSQSWVNKNSLTAAQLWWMKRRNAGVWETAGSAPRTTPTGDAPDLSAVGRSNLPWAAGLFGLARGDLCSPLRVSLLTLWVHKAFHKCPLQWGLAACPARLCELSVRLAAAFHAVKPSFSSSEIIASLETQQTASQLSQRPLEMPRHYKTAFFHLRAAFLAKQSPSSFPAECKRCTGYCRLPELSAH